MRLFVALDMPWSVREQLAALSGSGIPGARWVPPENYHLTLRFIGDIPGHIARDVDDALLGLRAKGFALTLTGMGTFSKGSISSALWVGVEKTPSLDHLRNKIETALQRCGLDPERRKFQPHVTLARLDNPAEAKVAGFVQAHNLFRSGSIPVEHFTLFSSLLCKDHAVYMPEAEYELA
jgi:2'-5' RNA ligase